MSPAEPLGVTDLPAMLAPVGLVLAVGAWLRLGQGRRIAEATVRAAVQLLAVGLVIGWVFERQTWTWTAGLLAAMTLVAGVTAGGQLHRHLSRLSLVLSLVLGAVTGLSLVYFGRAVIGLEGWSPRHLIPLGGMLLGNAMTAAVLAGERAAAELGDEAGTAEVYLSLGASPWQAMGPAVRRAVTAALTPTLNAMLVVGVVKLPGMMTGQMLGGAPPLQAAAYQLLILVGILLADLLTATATLAILRRRYFTSAWQLDREALAPDG